MNTKKVFYQITTAVITIAFLVTGIGNLIPVDHIAHDMAHLGYPPYFLALLGAWKVLAAVAMVIPRTPRIKEWAYAGMMFDLTGAAFSRFATGDAVPMILIPLLMACLVSTSWVLRTEVSRRDQPYNASASCSPLLS